MNQLIQKEPLLKGRICMKPFVSTEIHLNGKLYFCCPSWQKTPYGEYKENSLEKEWNSELAKDIRRSILEGSYKYCDTDMCPFIQSGDLKSFYFLKPEERKLIKEAKKSLSLKNQPRELMLNYDPSCNLSCESCRKEKISHSTDSEEFKISRDLTNKFTEDFFSYSNGEERTLNITGSGDPFASQVFREFLENLDGESFPNLKINLQTNGVLFTPNMWERLSKIHKNISEVFVSIDAASKETYLIVRKGGHWEKLLQNVEFLKSLKEKGLIDRLQFNFVVQKRNYNEMVEFVQKFGQEKFVEINFSLVDDWGSWEKSIYREHAVWDESHLEYGKFLALISHPIFELPQVYLGNLNSIREKALILKSKELSLSFRVKFKLNHFYKKKVKRYLNFIHWGFKKLVSVF